MCDVTDKVTKVQGALQDAYFGGEGGDPTEVIKKQESEIKGLKADLVLTPALPACPHTHSSLLLKVEVRGSLQSQSDKVSPHTVPMPTDSNSLCVWWRVTYEDDVVESMCGKWW